MTLPGRKDSVPLQLKFCEQVSNSNIQRNMYECIRCQCKDKNKTSIFRVGAETVILTGISVNNKLGSMWN
jgi:hypothetical protein